MKFETFKALHSAKDLFILPNAWDAGSAMILQESNYPAVGTSSAAVASSLGYSDGEGMPFEEYLMVIKRMAASVSIPFTVDLEMGYGKSQEIIYANIEKLIEAGVVGINIEDSIITNGKRSLNEANKLAETLTFIKNKLSSAGHLLFINLRCDTYLLDINNKLAETLHRMKVYESAGADGIFLPFIKDEADIAPVVANTRLPLNVMAIPGLPGMDKLNQLGVRRVSMGPFLHSKTYALTKALAKKVIEQKSIESII